MYRQRCTSHARVWAVRRSYTSEFDAVIAQMDQVRQRGGYHPHSQSSRALLCGSHVSDHSESRTQRSNTQPTTYFVFARSFGYRFFCPRAFSLCALKCRKAARPHKTLSSVAFTRPHGRVEVVRNVVQNRCFEWHTGRHGSRFRRLLRPTRRRHGYAAFPSGTSFVHCSALPATLLFGFGAVDTFPDTFSPYTRVTNAWDNAESLMAAGFGKQQFARCIDASIAL